MFQVNRRWFFAIVVVLGGASPAFAQLPFPYSLQVAAEGEKATATELPSYWLGITLRNADPALLEQLKLKNGVVVDDVAPDSPAAEAGIARHDVIVKAGEADIHEGGDLLKAVADAKDQEMTLVVVRAGKAETLKATPAKRPQDQIAVTRAEEEVAKAEGALEQALRTWQLGPGKREMEFQLMRPGVVMRGEPLPDDVKITVERQGKKLAQVTVSKGDDWWRATEKEIDTLPKEYQSAARAMLGLPSDKPFAFTEDGDIVKPRPTMRVRSFREDPLMRIEEELKQLRKDIEDLRKSPAAKP